MIRSALAAVAATAILVPVSASAAEAPAVVIPDRYHACQYEDSVRCVWDARHQGNGSGMSFYVNGKGEVTRLPHHLAHFLTHN